MGQSSEWNFSENVVRMKFKGDLNFFEARWQLGFGCGQDSKNPSE